MNPVAARVWTEQLLLRGALAPASRSAAARPSVPFARAFASSSQPAVRSKLLTHSCQQHALHILRGQRTAVSRRFRALRLKSDNKPAHTPDPTPHLGSPEPALSFSQRLKKLGREYGWLALGVYMGLTALDFPFCFLAVRMLGTDRIGHYEHVAIDAIKSVLQIPFPDLGKKVEPAGGPITDEISEATAREGVLGIGSEAEEAAAKESGAEASLWTQLVLAYAVHKSLIFFRIPLTAALLPKVAKTLRGWGYNVGKVKPK